MAIEGRSVRRWGVALVSSTAVIAVGLPAGTARAANGPGDIAAKGAFLLDSGANRALWGKGADTRREMASTTKVMTAVVVLDSRGVNLDRKVTVKKEYRDYVARRKASTADLRAGDRLTVRQLLYGLMLPSGCDAAYALADAVGSGATTKARTASFISRMNAKARSLGMTNTTYDSFDGISQGGRNRTTPRDMAKLARHAMGNRTFAAVVKSASTKQRTPDGRRTYTWYNTNKLLGSYNGAIGIKTGTGSAAGPCLVFAAKRGGRTIVGVLLNDANRYPDAKKMLDWAYGQRTAVQWRALPREAQRD
ncbi:D-alanyl-D-alanine carboxypeptidase family protein [Streptomyces sp. URMC 123]|uniref:D-alanyl-D-alanine carboxypeptidase family protein n=1 Tax=Streptomyces sp. URMC 123 TaxID=3423403 RepID=UPI003F1D8E2D